MATPTQNQERWQLYRLLGEPQRLRLLALCAEEELGVSELAELLGESQPNVSRHAAALRQAAVLEERREGTRLFVRLAAEAARDLVVQDALAAGRKLCEVDGSLSRVQALVLRRDGRTREFFSTGSSPEAALGLGLSSALPAYLRAVHLGLSLRRARGLETVTAFDIGTGDGVLLDVLAPIMDTCVAVDRSEAQLELARARCRARGYDHVTLCLGELEEVTLPASLRLGAELVIAARVLHHSPQPRRFLRALASCLRPGGVLVVIDYQPHEDEALREQQADVWLGFESRELLEFAAKAKLSAAQVFALPQRWLGRGADTHVGWQVLVAEMPELS